jgi:hypothetical protein
VSNRPAEGLLYNMCMCCSCDDQKLLSPEKGKQAANNQPAITGGVHVSTGLGPPTPEALDCWLIVG